MLIEGMTIAGIAVGATTRLHLRPLGVSACDRDAERSDRATPTSAGFLGDDILRLGPRLRARGAQGRRLLRLRRGDRAARKPRRQARHRARQAAAAGDRRACSASRRVINNVITLRQRAAHPGARRGVLPRLRHGPLARHACRSSWPATSSTAAWSRRRSASRCASCSTTSAAARRIGPADQGGAGGRAAGRLPARIAVGHAARLRGLRGRRRAMVGHGGIVVHDDTADMSQLARYAMEFCAIESCGKCTPCRIGSTRGVEVIDRIRADQNRPQQVMLLRDLCDTMVNGSLCAMGGMTPYPVLSALNHFPEDFGLVSPRSRGRLTADAGTSHARPSEARPTTARRARESEQRGHAGDRRPRGDRARGHVADARRGRCRHPGAQAVRHRQPGALRLLPPVPGRDRGPQGLSGLVHHAGRSRHEGAHADARSCRSCARA